MTLKVPKLRTLIFGTLINEKYERREISEGEAMNDRNILSQGIGMASRGYH